MKEKGKKILIDSNPFEKRLALVEDGRLAEFYVERLKDRGITGNIYKGRIVRVLPGMQAAFVEIGLERTAFLHASDVSDSFDDLEEEENESRGENRGASSQQIQDLISEGQEIMVQVSKEPIGTKGARITSNISIPGRHLVFMPSFDRVGVSRRISEDKERRRLRDIVQSLRPQGHGFIIRTVCEGMPRQDLKSDMDFLLRLWKLITRRMERLHAPSILFEELDLTLRTIRDIFSADVDELILGNKSEYDRARTFVDDVMPGLRWKVKLHEDELPIFDLHGVEIELAGTTNNKVWLRSGGHIIIDQMEALTAIDVNTGKYVGKKNSDETIFKTNTEAVKAVVEQIRLRNIGGIIVIDFIDMSRAAHREKVYRSLKDALKADKARTNILKISELGIVEMTRKRVRESISQSLCEPCPYCDGSAIVKNKETVVMEIYRDLMRDARDKMVAKAVIYANPDVAEHLRQDKDILKDIKKRFVKRLVIKSVEVFHQEEYEIL